MKFHTKALAENASKKRMCACMLYRYGEKEKLPTEARVQKHSGVSFPIELSKSKLLKNVL